MSVNYTPELQPYKSMGAFRFWCQKVLPLVYDDSLSYYELLCKVVSYLNAVIDNNDNMHTDIENLLIAYNQLQGWVNNYFDNLDVQDEINNKLDAMVEDGTMDVIINQHIFGEINDEITAIQTRLNRYLTPEMFGAVGDGTTDDSAAFQDAIDEIMLTGGNIVLTQDYFLDGDIVINRHSDVNNLITFIGLGKEAKIKTGNHTFKGSANDYGAIKFMNITFYDSTTIFTCDRKLIRVTCDGCVFDNITNICLSTGVTQSYYFLNCVMRDCDYVINGNDSGSRGYDIKISHSRIEAGVNCYIMPNSPTYGCMFVNNCIEGLTGTAFSFNVVRTAVISENYFEGNTHYIVCNSSNTNNLVIEENDIHETADMSFIELPPAVPYPAQIIITKNNIVDVTGETHIYSRLISTQDYSGLVVAYNNKMRDPVKVVGYPLDLNTMKQFVLSVDGETYNTLALLATQIASYAMQHKYYHSDFLVNWTDGTPSYLTGHINLQMDRGVVAINLEGNSWIAYCRCSKDAPYNCSIAKQVAITNP